MPHTHTQYIYELKPIITSVHYRCVVLNINATWNVKLQDSQQCLELGVLNNTAVYIDDITLSVKKYEYS